jgi:hypothetical protein
MNIIGNNLLINQNVHIVSAKASMYVNAIVSQSVSAFKRFSKSKNALKVSKTQKYSNIDKKREHTKSIYLNYARDFIQEHNISSTAHSNQQARYDEEVMAYESQNDDIHHIKDIKI